MPNFTKKIILYLFFAAAAFLNTTCDIKSPTEGIEVRIKNIPRTTTVFVEIVDAGARKQITQKVDLQFRGKNKADVISTVNEPLTSVSTTSGSYLFAIKDDVIPSADNPIELVISASSNNYLTSSEKIIITNTGGNTYSINLVATAPGSQPQGVSTNEVQKGSTEGASGTKEEIVVSSSSTGNETSATISIPPGTILKDSEGNVLSGNVTTRVSYFSPTEPEALSTFPGGFNANTDTRGSGQFFSAGFTEVTLKVNGQEVETFEGGTPEVTIDIAPGTINPETGTEVKAGDVIPMWSYNEETGNWKFEGNVTVANLSPAGGSKLAVKKQIKHLSWWNLDWWYSPTCYVGRKVVVTGGCFEYLYLQISVRLKGTQDILGSTYRYYVYKDRETTLLNAPLNPDPALFEVVINAYESYYAETPVGSVVVDDLCSGGDIPLPVNIGGGDEIDVTVWAVCPNGNTLAEGTLDLEIQKNGNWQYAGRIIDGHIQLCLNVGQTYNFRVFYDGEYHSRQYTVTSTTEFIEVEIGENIDLCN